MNEKEKMDLVRKIAREMYGKDIKELTAWELFAVEYSFYFVAPWKGVKGGNW